MLHTVQGQAGRSPQLCWPYANWASSPCHADSKKVVSACSAKLMSTSVCRADSKTDVAATLLRMLYIKDLRGLQTLIDETLVNVQVSTEG